MFDDDEGDDDLELDDPWCGVRPEDLPAQDGGGQPVETPLEPAPETPADDTGHIEPPAEAAAVEIEPDTTNPLREIGTAVDAAWRATHYGSFGHARMAAHAGLAAPLPHPAADPPAVEPAPTTQRFAGFTPAWFFGSILVFFGMLDGIISVVRAYSLDQSPTSGIEGAMLLLIAGTLLLILHRLNQPPAPPRQ